MKTTARRVVAALSSAVVLTSALALPTVAHASHGIKCGFVQINPNTYVWVCSRGV